MREGLLVLAAFALFPLAALLIGDDAAGPVARGIAIAETEEALGLHVEPAVHAWTLRHDTLMTVAGTVYVVAHVPVAGWALIWTWWLRRDAYPRLRATFLWTLALTVLVYVLAPTAPPRLLPGAGFTDTLADQWGPGLAESAHLLQSPYAAMPSGHVAFALVAGIAFARLGDQAWLRAFGRLYPPVVIAVTIATGHHFVLDAVAAALVVGLAFWLSGRTLLPRSARDRLRNPQDARLARRPVLE